MTENIDISPSPRVLRMLGEIDFKAWQCLCEIIDNSIDSFSSETFSFRSKSGLALGNKPKIQIFLPSASRSTLKESDHLIIKDNAEGMTYESLSKSLKAGYSNNDATDKMGLFGMGFNISTARLGKRTEVITTTKESKEFLKVTIDFQELEKSGHFLADIEKIPKKADEKNKHGTEVRITKLRTDLVKPLYLRTRQREKLGKIYGSVLINKEITLDYDGQKCRPFQHCVWDKSRSGKNKNGAVPAFIKVDELLDEKKFCSTCWIWIDTSETNCPVCNQDSNVKKRERRIKGWVGIQRYFDAKNYGIDLIRNGRVIKEYDKSFFIWQDPKNDFEEELEYPIDGHQTLGRIVGELEIDFVRVSHQKDAFDINTQDWRDVRLFIRGDAPIRPKIARNLGYPENTSPIAQLFSAFRTAKAGVANLVPQKRNGQAMIRDPFIDDLKEGFINQVSELQGDEKWWELLNQTYIDPPDDDEDDEEDPFEEEEDEEDEGGEGEGEGEDEDEPDNDLETIPDKNLSQKYRLDLFKNIDIRVVAEIAQIGSNKNGFTVQLGGNELTFVYWPNAPIFKETLWQPADFLINELAYHFHAIAQNELSRIPITAVELKLREKYFSDLHPTLSELRTQVLIFQEDLIEHFKSKTPDFEINISVIKKNDLETIKQKLSQNEFLDDQQIEEALQKGEFMSYASFNILKALMIEHPQLFFDGEFFSKKWTSEEINSDMKNDIDQMRSLLNDIEWFNENSSASVGKLWRGRMIRLAGSLEILTNWRV